ncbi:MAG: DUF6077 domain-containing protein [Roseburia sp.]|nr:DUF6077 domain-containing protein [Roseburia sp.]
MTKRYYWADCVATAAILLIGAAEAAHLYGVFLNQPLEKCIIIFGAAGLTGLAALAGAAVYQGRKGKKSDGGKTSWTGWEAAMLAVFLLLLLSQLCFVTVGGTADRRSDITLETVGSFLEEDGIYRVNPITGNLYEAGFPNRIKILCLPTMYAMLCRLSGVSPAAMVWRVIPAAALLCSYAAYLCLAKSLFPGNRRRQLFFLMVTALLIWVGSYRGGMEGFQLLYSGWRGVSWRGAVLIPYTVSLCLRKKYLHSLLCALAEACVVWTLYGLGMCLLVTGGMALAAFLLAKSRPGKEGQGWSS